MVPRLLGRTIVATPFDLLALPQAKNQMWTQRCKGFAILGWEITLFDGP